RALPGREERRRLAEALWRDRRLPSFPRGAFPCLSHSRHLTMNKSPIRIATAQGWISADVRANGQEIRSLMRQARSRGASLAHFPEGAMSGYTKSQIKDWGQVDWGTVDDELRQTAALAGALGLWVVFGCSHRLTPPHRPHNSLYVISDRGELMTRYDKRFLSHTEV